MAKAKKIKELELTCTLRNNRLKARRSALGMTRGELAEAAGVQKATYGQLEALKRDPHHKRTGEWTKTATMLAEFFRTVEEELFPSGVLHVRKPEVVRTINEVDVANLLSDHQQRLLLLPDALMGETEFKDSVDKILGTLSNREERVLRMRFGIGFSGDHTQVEIGQEQGVGGERIRQIEAKALRKLRHPSRKDQLRVFLNLAEDEERESRQ